MYIKLTVNLPTASVDELRVYATECGITMTEAIRQALALQSYLAEEESRGGKILLEERSGELRRLVW